MTVRQVRCATLVRVNPGAVQSCLRSGDTSLPHIFLFERCVLRRRAIQLRVASSTARLSL